MDIALTVACPYCGADRHQACRQTMLDGRPVTDTHQTRIQYAQEVPF
jgi:hypothetical protein